MSSKEISTVFFVEDSDDEVFLSRIMFEKSQIEANIIHADSYDALIGSLTDNIQLLDNSMIIVDMNLPEMRGVEIIERLRKIVDYAGMIIGICSGSEDPADKKASIEAGADFFVSKPLNIHSLEKICQIIGELSLDRSDDKTVRILRQ